MYHTLSVALFVVALLSSTAKSNKVEATNAVFDINEAYTQLMYAYSAYCPEANVTSWNCFFCTYNVSDTKGFKIDVLIKNAVTNTFGFVGSNGKTVIVSFRGTQGGSLTNWISDLDFAHSTPYPNVPNAFVHSGFLDTYNVVKAAVRKSVFALVDATKATKVVFTGHSLGAALTTLCAIDIAPSLNIPYFVYNFGSPRVGNPVFATYYDSVIPNTFRVVNRADTVPHLPVVDMGFHHVAQEVWFNSATHYTVCDASGEDPKCSDSVHLWNIPDHLDYMQIKLEQGGC